MYEERWRERNNWRGGGISFKRELDSPPKANRIETAYPRIRLYLSLFGCLQCVLRTRPRLPQEQFTLTIESIHIHTYICSLCIVECSVHGVQTVFEEKLRLVFEHPLFSITRFKLINTLGSLPDLILYTTAHTCHMRKLTQPTRSACVDASYTIRWAHLLNVLDDTGGRVWRQ